MKKTITKSLIIVLIGSFCYLFSNFSFHGLETMIRDSLQYTNNSSAVNHDIATVNLDIESKLIKRPFQAKDIQSVVELIEKSNPRSIVLLFEPIDFTDNEQDNLKLVQFLNQRTNVLLGDTVSNPSYASFSHHKIFKDVKKFFTPPSATTDSNFGAQDKRWRRSLLRFENMSNENFATELQKLGLTAKKVEDFKYPFLIWNTVQVYVKTYKVGTFGHHQYSNLLKSSEMVNFENKVVLIGAFDEFSYLSKPSVLNLFGQLSSTNFKESYYPYQDYVAGIINLWNTGDYIKYLSSVSDMWIVFILLSIIILSPFSAIKKLILFVSLIPIILFFIFALYWTTGFYIDFSRSIAMLVFCQYFIIPISTIWYLITDERKKTSLINNARIDALLAVSEKVAHDIRSPLSTINLIMTKANFTSPDHNNLIQSSINRIENIVDSLLLKTKSVDHANSQISYLDIENTIYNLFKEKKIIAPKVSFELLHKNIQPSKNVFSNTTDLERILSNLIDNSLFALKLNKTDPKVSITTGISNDYLEIELTDNGSGIPENILKLVGTQRITTKGLREGNGIGILHSKRLIEQMGGNFDIYSDGTSTTTIKISLKMAP